MIHGPTLLLEFYPILSVDKITIDGEVTSLDYKLDKESGIIYMNTPVVGDLEVEYTTGFTDEEYESIILPLLYDFICYNIYAVNHDGNEISSVKEGEVSVNYDTSNTWYNKVYGRINRLKESYNCRCTML